jgi:uncharacterized protein YlbG (UPF0298 family)
MCYEMRQSFKNGNVWYKIYKDDKVVYIYTHEREARETMEYLTEEIAVKAFSKAHKGSLYLSTPFTDPRSGMGRKS